MIPKQQHWIPQFYLEYFAATTSKKGQAQAWIFSKHPDAPTEPRLVGVNGICKQSYLHSPKKKGADERDGALDRKLGDLETTMSKIWPTLANENYTLDLPEVKNGLALFMAVLYLRHPAQIETQAEIHRQLMEQVSKGPADTQGVPLLDAIMIKGQRYPFDTSGWDEWRNAEHDDHHRSFADTIEREAMFITKLLLAKRWTVVVAKSSGYITSDRCVAAHHREHERFGLGTPGTIITFPLSPTRLLMLDDMLEEPGNKYYEEQAGFGISNYLIWRGAHEFMISPRHPDQVLLEMDQAAQTIPITRGS